MQNPLRLTGFFGRLAPMATNTPSHSFCDNLHYGLHNMLDDCLRILPFLAYTPSCRYSSSWANYLECSL
ncbi:hypothetical protein K443DRAFT_256031 [Laccaria amethystina LaAM-08-1]|uniref:Uncharacterized protein n=1 Tax=Laccaria amethystina LaAM-08-1 TaxID=1095629 RepID=A0A0C9WLH5_9AGAR|nr:hypothetical protein K443DRAFT_256031 [Laccaria amethystina LaAM-08-1]